MAVYDADKTYVYDQLDSVPSITLSNSVVLEYKPTESKVYLTSPADMTFKFAHYIGKGEVTYTTQTLTANVRWSAVAGGRCCIQFG